MTGALCRLHAQALRPSELGEDTRVRSRGSLLPHFTRRGARTAGQAKKRWQPNTTNVTELTKGGQAARRRRRRGRTRAGADDTTRSVPLYKRSASHFERGDRQRGNEYFLDERVSFEIDGSRARARVQGTERPSYVVGLDWSEIGERVLHAFCECQRFADGRPCKHVWATLLALAESELEKDLPGRDRLSVRKDRAENWPDLDVTQFIEPRKQTARDTPGRGRASRGGSRSKSRRRSLARAVSWRSQLVSLRRETERLSKLPESAPSPPDRAPAIHFLINTSLSTGAEGLVLDVFARNPDGAGQLGKPKAASVAADHLQELLLPEKLNDEQQAPLVVLGSLPADSPGRRDRSSKERSRPPGVRRLSLPRRLQNIVLPRLCASGALGWWDGHARGKKHTLSWDAGLPWHLTLRLDINPSRAAHVRGDLKRRDEIVPLSDAVLLLLDEKSAEPKTGASSSALVLLNDTIAPLEIDRERDLPWLNLLSEAGEIAIPREDLEEALSAILELPLLPPLEAPDELQLSPVSSSPRPRVVLEPDVKSVSPTPPLVAQLSFLYGSQEVSAADPRPSIIDWEKRTFLQRDMDWEQSALVRLLEAGLRPEASGQGQGLEISSRELPMVVEPLLREGWDVEARGTSLRSASPPSLRVESGIDWFELSGSVDFAGDRVELSEILQAISKGERFVELEDGSEGLLPESWVETWDSLADLAHSSSDEGLRFLPSQAMLVDAALATMPPVDVDQTFAQLRTKLQSFECIKAKKEPRGFKGTLREYQRTGLGWLDFLREYGLGGVLADDMGLGKTVQVLAMLRANRTPSKTTGLPSLVVAPRSLVYNWIDEAARFTPTLKVVEYGGPGREALKKKLTKFDLVVTTYGTLRRDISYLATIEFDTVILDEAQAIKNRGSQAARASRLLNGRHRLALTGTPIENHLGELGSLFEFLNPGLLGRLPNLDALNGGRAASKQELALVANGMRPFILRRTKAQVLDDLPPKTEQILFCTLTPDQQELYDKLRAGYQATLLENIDSQGPSGSAMQVLEALLRLRQVACHPGLVDAAWEDAGSAKLEALFDQISEVLEEGHKLLIFSQFTKLLAYVQRHLEEQAIDFAYLDGQTRNRGEVVERFQTDPDCNVFVISLKAGGLGLNLTAAGYVFLLDPWWNPAVEAQAIDRAHRIGQTQPVFSYRLIARDTVEEKILELQRSKRQLAEMVLEGEGQTLGSLNAEDLRKLLS